MRNFNKLAVLAVLAGCGGPIAFISDDEVTTPETVKSAEAWQSQDNPSLFGGNLVLELDALPTEGQAANISWAGSYWPTFEDNINYR